MSFKIYFMQLLFVDQMILIIFGSPFRKVNIIAALLQLVVFIPFHYSNKVFDVE